MKRRACDEDGDAVAEDVVLSLARSQRPIKKVVYTSQSWNIEFMQVAAEHLRSLELLHIKNKSDDPLRGMRGSQDDFIVSVTLQSFL